MVNDTGVLVWGKAQETLQSSMSVWRGHSLILNVIYNNNKKVKTIRKKNTTEEKVFFCEYEDKGHNEYKNW